MSYGVMAAHLILVQRILVRIQVGQHKRSVRQVVKVIALSRQSHGFESRTEY